MKSRYNLGARLTDKFATHKIFVKQAPFDDVMWTSYLGPNNAETIEDLKSYDLAVFDFSSEHWGSDGRLVNSMHDVLTSAHVNFLILSHNPLHHAPDQGILYYPHWYEFARRMFDPVPITDEKQFLLGCLNGTPRSHRIANLCLLKNKPYWDQCCTSFYFVPDAPQDPSAVKLNTDEIEFWNVVGPQLPRRGQACSDTEINLPAVTDSYINLVTETSVRPDIFLSEKIWKPIAAGQLFVALGNPGTMTFLQAQGVDTFSDIIDHRHYDNEPNWRQRLRKLHEVLDDLTTQDLPGIYKHTHERRRQNQQSFFSGLFAGQYHQTLLDTIEKRLQCINMLN